MESDSYASEFWSRLGESVGQRNNRYIYWVMQKTGKVEDWAADVVQEALTKMLLDFDRNQGMKLSENGVDRERIDLDRSLDSLVYKNCDWVMHTKLARDARDPCELLDDQLQSEQSQGCDPTTVLGAKAEPWWTEDVFWILDHLPQAFDSVTGQPKLAADAVRREPKTIQSSTPNYERIGELITAQIGEVFPQSTIRQWWCRARQQICEYFEGNGPEI